MVFDELFSLITTEDENDDMGDDTDSGQGTMGDDADDDDVNSDND
jgi:hypothetical protein